MKHVFAFCLVYFAIVMQWCVASELTWYELRPEFPLLALLALPLLFDGASAIVWAGLCGLLADCLLPGRPGIGMATAGVVTLFASHPLRTAVEHSQLRVVPIAFAAALACSSLSVFFHHLSTHHVIPSTDAFAAPSANACATVVLGLGLLVACRLLLLITRLRLAT